MTFTIKLRTSAAARTQAFLRCSRHFFFVAGILVLGCVTFMLIDAQLYQAHETRRFQQALKNRRPAARGGALHLPVLVPVLAGANRAGAGSPGIAPRRGSPLGRIEINSIGLAVMILEGDDAKTLRLGVGHIPGTALPGQPGNVAIAGHRDTFFRALRKLQKGDEITLTTLSGTYGYRVDSMRVVEPQDTEVLNNSDASTLTLVTCYPFYFVGRASKRFIVRANWIPR